MATYTPTSDTHFSMNMSDGYPLDDVLSLDKIATEHYGRTYEGQQTGDMMRNDTVHGYNMHEHTVANLMYDMELKRTYLGRNPYTNEPGFALGVNWFDYWLALESTDRVKTDWSDPASAYLANLRMMSEPKPWEDARGHIYDHDTVIVRAAPTPDYVLADLITKGVLPYGKYLLYVGW